MTIQEENANFNIKSIKSKCLCKKEKLQDIFCRKKLQHDTWNMYANLEYILSSKYENLTKSRQTKVKCTQDWNLICVFS